MDEKNLIYEKADPGAIDHGDEYVSFAIYSPGKKSVSVIASFNGWNSQQTTLTEREPGFWVSVIKLSQGEYFYQFLIDDEIVICDPYAREISYRNTNNEIPTAIIRINEKPFIWEHDHWPRHSLRDLIIYEMHIGDFTPEGSFNAATAQLGYLKELGINAIQLTPVCEAKDYWGYKPTYLFAPWRKFGTPNELRNFIDQAHGHDIAVILDMVVAHTAHEHPFNQMYPYEESPWYGPVLGESNQFGLPSFNFLNDATNFFVTDIARHWLLNYHVDGFRYDYLAGIGTNDERKGLPTVIGEARKIRPHVFLIGECIPEDADLVNDSGLSAVWHTRSRLALQTLLIETDVEPYTFDDFEEVVQVLDPKTQEYVSAEFMINYIESHDDERLLYALQNSEFDDDLVFKKIKLAISILMTIPGQPMIYQGQEWGEATPNNGPKENKIQWQLKNDNLGRGITEYLKSMCKLRKTRSSFRSENFSFLTIDVQKRCIAYKREYGQGDIAIVGVNFSHEKQTLKIPLPKNGYWHQFMKEPFYIENQFVCDLEGCGSIILLS
ncbi:MAG: alpha-amylase family glycosyl hydrolase [Bacteriovoracia bacterium]